MKQKNITHWLKVAVIGIALGLGLQFVRAWTEPSVAPPGGNLGAPINTSATAQTKAGRLDIQGGSAMPYMWDSDNASYSLDPSGYSNVNVIQSNYSFNGPVYDYNNGNFYIDPGGVSSVYSLCFWDGCRTSWGGFWANCYWSLTNMCYDQYPGYFMTGVYYNDEYVGPFEDHLNVTCCRL